MLVAATILGVLGGALGLASAFFVLSAALGVSSALVAWLGAFGIFFSVLGIIGGVLALTRPRVAGILMIVGAAGGFMTLFMPYAPAFILQIAGGVYALIGSCEPARGR